MQSVTDIIQVTADNTNVFSGRFGSTLKPWARQIRLQVVASDTDWTFSAAVFGEEIARDSAPHQTAADNTQSIDWTKDHIIIPVKRSAIDYDPLVNLNVVTGGVGLVAIRQES